MEISPIAGIRNLPVAKAPAADAGLSAVFDIENFASIGDETYSPSGGKSAGGREDEFEDPADEGEAPAATTALDEGPARQISFFA